VKVNIASALGKDVPVEATDYGYIMLPENYTKDGEPTRLVIICHGAGASFDTYKSFNAKTNSQTYWLDMGYAIMDMYACPPALGDKSEMHYGNPTVLECYEKGYEYVMKRFNLKTDGIFVLGSSMGGLSSFQIVQSGKFPVLAQVANCPVIDLFKQAYCNPWTTVTYQREHISSYFGFEGTKPAFTNSKHSLSQAEIDYFRNNFEKVIPYSPIFANVTSGDITSIFDKLPANATVADAPEAALYSQLTATHPCPLLIIHNKNDSTVSYRYSEYLKGMLERGGSNVELVLYDTGNHNAWDNGPQGMIENYKGDMVQHSESRRLAIEFFRSFDS
jgi:pimeloyl-ACP methyl ester carboxylesterase